MHADITAAKNGCLWSSITAWEAMLHAARAVRSCNTYRMHAQITAAKTGWLWSGITAWEAMLDRAGVVRSSNQVDACKQSYTEWLVIVQQHCCVRHCLQSGVFGSLAYVASHSFASHCKSLPAE
ncbi:hypothetical protein DUNSADRAFT_13266 [Dunaliella salina]|uniref:Encoded protein n=1 Tax=Dunaliella salina TaxID=3046 RepID=A0ABQ7G9T7_DUNSA|nr:hypothetical protein DUNSADRAFT_13266 [Dunaliella salina]|eukprot:KAF5831359.1 hypothetical protein DUNSADRAFT_13266 [Dunaliella salina]